MKKNNRKKQEQKRNKRILLALIMLLVSGVVLATSTYAWFSANTAISATGIDVKVTASAGIAISADAVDFNKTVDMDDVIAFAKEGTYASSLQLPEELSPVSTPGLIGGTSRFSFFKGTLGEQDVVSLLTSAENHTFKAADSDFTGGDYVAFDVYIRSSIEQQLKLNANTKVLPNQNITAANDAYMQSALRMGFLGFGTSSDTAAATSQASAVALSTAQTDWKIYNPFPYLHHASTLDGYNATEDEATIGYLAARTDTQSVTSFNSLGETAQATDEDRHYVKFLPKDVTSVPSYLTKITPGDTFYLQGASDTDLVPTGSLITVGAGITKMRIYIWVEGNDVDCVDSISISEGLTIQLGFEVVRTSP